MSNPPPLISPLNPSFVVGVEILINVYGLTLSTSKKRVLNAIHIKAHIYNLGGWKVPFAAREAVSFELLFLGQVVVIENKKQANQI